jgi:hypothetical protein
LWDFSHVVFTTFKNNVLHDIRRLEIKRQKYTIKPRDAENTIVIIAM